MYVVKRHSKFCHRPLTIEKTKTEISLSDAVRQLEDEDSRMSLNLLPFQAILRTQNIPESNLSKDMLLDPNISWYCFVTINQA